MALTANEKKVLGIMTDRQIIYGDVREEIAADDALARAKIAEWVAAYLPELEVRIASISANLSEMQEQETAINNYLGEQ
jgi:hypothetical protein